MLFTVRGFFRGGGAAFSSFLTGGSSALVGFEKKRVLIDFKRVFAPTVQNVHAAKRAASKSGPAMYEGTVISIIITRK